MRTEDVGQACPPRAEGEAQEPQEDTARKVAVAKPHAVYRWRLIVLPLVLALRMLGYTVRSATRQ